jgi:arabinogalactan oligomer/maltooligosaccharide transport system permease protein
VKRLERIVIHVALVAACAFAVYPLLWVVTLALSPAGAGAEPRIIPLTTAPSLANFAAVLGVGSPDGVGRFTSDGVGLFTSDGVGLFVRQLANSLVVSLSTALVAVMVATPAAYALARFPFVGARAGVRALLLTQMFPTVASAVPLYLLLDALKLLDTRTGLVLVYASTAVPFAIFQLRGAFLAIPVDIEEAAMVDGATRARAFWLVVLPAARPALAVTGLFAFMSAWNEFILAATLLSRKTAYTLPVVIQSYVQEQSTAWGPFAAGAILVSAPVMALFYVAQGQLVSGLTQGGVKG